MSELNEYMSDFPMAAGGVRVDEEGRMLPAERNDHDSGVIAALLTASLRARSDVAGRLSPALADAAAASGPSSSDGNAAISARESMLLAADRALEKPEVVKLRQT
eukprot:TRINITY_DN7981_c0_g3_i1.p2 TRINITY_DN7981_c0_g3~~TRINITY_DN7981_c0_g3_i1.p2  ORF type:complete len:105 (-),score=33.93 TRINITY_DN7981_c0_g3_i1:34-348(-)